MRVSRVILIASLVASTVFPGAGRAAQGQAGSAAKVAVAVSPTQVPRLRGLVLAGPARVPGIAVAVQRLSVRGDVVLVGTALTDAQGRFTFVLPFDPPSTRYRLTPRHPAYPKMATFHPPSAELRASDDVQPRFYVAPNTFEVSAKVLGSPKPLKYYEMALYEARGKLPPRLVTKSFAPGLFWHTDLGWDLAAKELILRPRHPHLTASGTGFSPPERRFVLTRDVEHVFTYAGPLPDLASNFAPQESKPNATDKQWAFTVHNRGPVATGPYRVRLICRDANPGPPQMTLHEQVPGHAPNSARQVVFSFPNAGGVNLLLRQLTLDCDDHVSESDESNNRLQLFE